MTKNSFRFIHVDQDFKLSGTDVPSGTPAYAHAPVMRALLRIKDVCEESILPELPGLERELSAMVLMQHEQYSQLILLDSDNIDEESLELQLIKLRLKHLPPQINRENPSNRVFPRYKTQLKMLLEDKKGNVIEATSNNVSIDGLCANFKIASAVKNDETLKLYLLGKSRQLQMRAYVAWSFNGPDGCVAGISLKFDDSESMIDWLKFITGLHLRTYPDQTIVNIASQP